jgi:hypothetical protein
MGGSPLTCTARVACWDARTSILGEKWRRAREYAWLFAAQQSPFEERAFFCQATPCRKPVYGLIPRGMWLHEHARSCNVSVSRSHLAKIVPGPHLDDHGCDFAKGVRALPSETGPADETGTCRKRGARALSTLDALRCLCRPAPPKLHADRAVQPGAVAPARAL